MGEARTEQHTFTASEQHPMTIQEYIETINRRYKVGNATEHRYRGDLQNLLKVLASHVEVTNEPQRIDCGREIRRWGTRLHQQPQLSRQPNLPGNAMASALHLVMSDSW